MTYRPHFPTDAERLGDTRGLTTLEKSPIDSLEGYPIESRAQYTGELAGAVHEVEEAVKEKGTKGKDKRKIYTIMARLVHVCSDKTLKAVIEQYEKKVQALRLSLRAPILNYSKTDVLFEASKTALETSIQESLAQARVELSHIRGGVVDLETRAEFHDLVSQSDAEAEWKEFVGALDSLHAILGTSAPVSDSIEMLFAVMEASSNFEVKVITRKKLLNRKGGIKKRARFKEEYALVKSAVLTHVLALQDQMNSALINSETLEGLRENLKDVIAQARSFVGLRAVLKRLEARVNQSIDMSRKFLRESRPKATYEELVAITREDQYTSNDTLLPQSLLRFVQNYIEHLEKPRRKPFTSEQKLAKLLAVIEEQVQQEIAKLNFILGQVKVAGSMQNMGATAYVQGSARVTRPR